MLLSSNIVPESESESVDLSDYVMILDLFDLFCKYFNI